MAHWTQSQHVTATNEGPSDQSRNGRNSQQSARDRNCHLGFHCEHPVEQPTKSTRSTCRTSSGTNTFGRTSSNPVELGMIMHNPQVGMIVTNQSDTVLASGWSLALPPPYRRWSAPFVPWTALCFAPAPTTAACACGTPTQGRCWPSGAWPSRLDMGLEVIQDTFPCPRHSRSVYRECRSEQSLLIGFAHRRCPRAQAAGEGVHLEAGYLLMTKKIF